MTHAARLVSQSMKNCAASVATARYNPRMRRLGRPNTMPNTMAMSPPPSSASSSGMPSKRACRLKAAYAPTAMKAPVPSEIWPQ